MPWIDSKDPAIGGVYDSSTTTADRDGNILERTEFLIQSVLNAQQVKTVQSDSLMVNLDAYSFFNVYITDIDSNAYAVDEIIITAATITLEKSHNGGAFSAVGITQPILTKSIGLLSTTCFFSSLQWEAEDLYKLDISGVTISDGVQANLPNFVWSNATSLVSDIDAEVDVIYSAITFPTADLATNSTIAQVIGNKSDTASGTSLVSLNKQSHATEALIKTETDKIPATITKIDLIKTETDKVPATIVKVDNIQSKLASIYSVMFPNVFLGGTPRSLNRYGLIQITNIANNNNIVAGNFTYTFVTVLGSPGANQVHIKIQGTIKDSCKMFVKAIDKTTDADNILYGAGVVANPLFLSYYTSKRLGGSTSTLSEGDNLIMYQIEEDVPARTLTTTTTGTLIAPARVFHQTYTFTKNSLLISSPIQLIIAGDVAHGDVTTKIIHSVTIPDMSTGTDKEIDLLISNDEITFTQIYHGLDITNVGQYVLPQYYPVPSGYSVYARGRSSGTNNSETIDIVLNVATYV